MKFCTFTLIDNSPDPITGVRLSATLDQLSGGRLDIIIGKGNDPDQNALFGYDIHGPWDRNAEKYELLRQLIREEELTWSGRYRPDLIDATTQPRPLQDPLPIWHGSASSTESTELAAKWGDPLFSANGFHPLAKYAALIDHYRQRWVDYGRDSADAVVGAGFNGLYVGKTSQQALDVYRPIFTAFMASPGAIHNKLPFTSLEDFLETGSVLVGSPEQIIDKFGRYQAAFGHELSGIATEVPGLPDELNRESVERFVGDVVPVLRAAYPSRVWA